MELAVSLALLSKAAFEPAVPSPIIVGGMSRAVVINKAGTNGHLMIAPPKITGIGSERARA
jgi:hypothetical protein